MLSFFYFITLFSIVNVKRDYGALLATVLKIGTCEDHAVLGEKLTRAQVVNVTSEKDIGRGINDKLAVADIESAVASDNDLYVVDSLGNVLYMLTAYHLCHFPTVFLTVGIFTFRQSFKNSHILPYPFIEVSRHSYS